MKEKQIQLDILNDSMRTCIAMYKATKNKAYLEAAKRSADKFKQIMAGIDPDSDMTVVVQ